MTDHQWTINKGLAAFLPPGSEEARAVQEEAGMAYSGFPVAVRRSYDS
jgi:hypothetical protein